jgi:hyperosmotically inducible periplasmic protein
MKIAVIFVGLSLAAAVAGCDRADDKHAGTTSAANVPADNTKKNERDRDPAAVTPLDQGENAADLAITQKIRQDVIKDDTLSMAAKNVKIITANGVVTLRGPVKSDKEKADIGAFAQRAEGVKRVDNQLEIEAH